MKQHLNTLYVTLEDAYLRKDGAAVEIRHQGETRLRVPLHNLEGIVTFGWDTTVSASLMAGCHKQGVSLTFLTPTANSSPAPTVEFPATSCSGASNTGERKTKPPRWP